MVATIEVFGMDLDRQIEILTDAEQAKGRAVAWIQVMADKGVFRKHADEARALRAKLKGNKSVACG